MAAKLVSAMGKRCLLQLDAYFAVGPVFAILKEVRNTAGERLVHIVTRAKSNVVAYEDPPISSGGPGRPRKYGEKLKLTMLFDSESEAFESIKAVVYGKSQSVSVLCLDLIWMPVKEKVRFVLVADGTERFILMCSDLTLSAAEIICAYGYRFKIEVSFKVLKHVMGTFCYRFWTHAWPRIGKGTKSDLSTVDSPREKNLIGQVADAIEAFVNFGCIATGILQIIALNFHETVWYKYSGWLRTVRSTIPTEEVVKAVVQEEFYHNFRFFKNEAIYEIIMSKSKKHYYEQMPLAA